ncbi:MAG: hypothetical protein K0V04_30225 [Deltaproteobacteria bacterium]|nr:hypothetical protein [Deltaproteobacteria bacterium]
MVKTWSLALALLAGCGALESEPAQQAKRVASKAVARGVDEAEHQLRRIDTAKIRAGWDAMVDAVAEASGDVARSGSVDNVDPLAGAAEAITCDAAAERCTVTAEFAARARSHGGRVAAQVRAGPVKSPVYGVRIEGVSPGSIAYLFGMRSGDIVTRVNGINPSSVMDSMSLYSQAKTARRFDVRYRRGDVDRVLVVDVE